MHGAERQVIDEVVGKVVRAAEDVRDEALSRFEGVCAPEDSADVEVGSLDDDMTVPQLMELIDPACEVEVRDAAGDELVESASPAQVAERFADATIEMFIPVDENKLLVVLA